MIKRKRDRVHVYDGDQTACQTIQKEQQQTTSKTKEVRLLLLFLKYMYIIIIIIFFFLYVVIESLFLVRFCCHRVSSSPRIYFIVPSQLEE